ncbi:peptidoglycan-binding protein [Streptomyces tanashiensis]|uniref:Peptidoglycan-binding protein n=1 Tax=Streptomyces tanashiensis TaxID=67367 RepID=A0ABY6R2Y3_9ACTN|nr:peptidoglycan-binding protein [Streptomyces tanashiensis]UZX23821.1 peptidoglycan-binding protein [Streptomyces tanashiensis]
MSVPVFEEFEPAADCGCPGCARQRRDLALGLPVRAGGHPAAHGARRALVLVTAAGVVLGGGGTGVATALTGPSGPLAPADAPADAPTDAPGAAPEADPVDGDPVLAAPAVLLEPATAPPSDPAVAVDTPWPGPETPQGGRGPLHGAPGPGPDPGPIAVPTTSQTATEALRPTTRAEIVNRAKKWVSAQVPYSMEKYWSDGYRQDCSGYISMAWNLRSNEWTGSLDRFAERIDRTELQPGDILLFHNPANPTRGSHVTIFGGWTDYTHTSYLAYEQTKPRTRKQATPMAYWENSDRYVAYRYKGVVSGSTGGGAEPAEAAPYPGAGRFGPGANNAYVTRLGQLLVERGGKKFYTRGPGPKWGEADRRATQAFQLAQGWKGREADGLPGPQTWKLLVTGGGKDIGGSSGSGGPSTNATGFPGRGYFRPGQSNAYVEKLGKQLVKRGFGKHYLSGPGPRWTEADRRNVEAFQRAQGWRGAAADGYPGPETWRRLFR